MASLTDRQVEIGVFVALLGACCCRRVHGLALAPAQEPRQPRGVGRRRPGVRQLGDLVPHRRRVLHRVHLHRRPALLLGLSARSASTRSRSRSSPRRWSSWSAPGSGRSRTRTGSSPRPSSPGPGSARAPLAPGRGDHRHRGDDALHRGAADRSGGRVQDGRHHRRVAAAGLAGGRLRSPRSAAACGRRRCSRSPRTSCWSGWCSRPCWWSRCPAAGARRSTRPSAGYAADTNPASRHAADHPGQLDLPDARRSGRRCRSSPTRTR